MGYNRSLRTAGCSASDEGERNTRRANAAGERLARAMACGTAWLASHLPVGDSAGRRRRLAQEGDSSGAGTTFHLFAPQMAPPFAGAATCGSHMHVRVELRELTRALIGWVSLSLGRARQKTINSVSCSLTYSVW